MEYGVSLSTLWRYVNCVSSPLNRSGNQSLVSMGDQKAVSNWIREACLVGFAPTKLQILIKVKGVVQGP